MSYTNKKITQAEINDHHVQGATDYLIGNPQQNKAVFDDLPEFIAGRFNELIDELNVQQAEGIQEAVDEWLAEHPEATTTVQDNSLTTAKYIDRSVTEPKIAEGAVTPSKLDRAYSTPDDLASVNANLTNELNVLDARMDTFASLPDGSTSGDAELLDIRSGADGVTYSSAGDAVRVQFSNVKNDINRLDNLSFDNEDYSLPVSWFERGSISAGANDSYRSGSRARTKTIISFNSVASITVTNGQFTVYYYDANGNYVTASGWKTNADVVAIKKNQKIRVLCTLNNGAPASQTDALVDMVKILRVKTDKTQPHISQRLDMSFEHGSLVSGNNDDYNFGARIRNKTIMQFPFSIGISMTSGAYIVHVFHEDNSIAYVTAWRTTEEYIIPPHAKFRLLLTNDTGSAGYTDIQTILDNLVIRPMNYSASLNPNIIYQCRNVDENVFPPYSKWYIQAAAQNQYDRVRFNVRKTTDGYYFLCHDDTINSEARNPDGSEISTSISTNGRTLAELNSYDWGIKYGAYYAGASVPMLEDALLYSSMFNMGVTIELSSRANWTATDTNNLLTMFDKYGVTENLIFLVGGSDLVFLKQLVEHNDCISVYVGKPIDWWMSSININALKALHTNRNKIYVQLLPWGSLPTDEFINIAKVNDFTLYSSTAMSKAALLTTNMFNKGFNLIEANNVYAIKDAVRSWVNNLVDA